MMQADTPQQASYIYTYTTHRNKLHTLIRNHIKLHVCLKYQYYPNNYTIHTSQAATTSRATQTADFSEAEESTDSDDNEIGHHGKKSAEEARKEQAPKPHKCQQLKRIWCKKEITTQVRYRSLRHAETEANTKHERKDPAPPQRFVAGITNLQRLTATVEQVVNILNYTLKIFYYYYYLLQLGVHPVAVDLTQGETKYTQCKHIQ
jgi:hypothetical protein